MWDGLKMVIFLSFVCILESNCISIVLTKYISVMNESIELFEPENLTIFEIHVLPISLNFAGYYK